MANISSWQEISIHDLGKVVTGKTPSTSIFEYYGGDIPFVTPTDMNDRRLISNTGRYLTKEGAEAVKASKISAGTVMVSCIGSQMGKVAIAGKSCVTNQQINSIIVSPDYSELFVYYSLRLREDEIRFIGSGSAVPILNKTDFSNLPIVIPPLPEQRAIAGILGALDDKIEVNRRMNATLESMARAVFRQWFVENEEAKGWEVQTLQQHIEAEKGLSYKGEGLSKNGGTPMHNLNSVYEGGGYKYKGIKYYTGEYRERHILLAGDIIVTNTEQGFQYLLIGFPAIVPKHFGKTGIFTHHIFRVRPLSTSPIKTHYLYFLLMSPYVRDQIIACTNGTTVNMLNADGLKSPKFNIPPKKLIDKFEQFATLIFKKMELLYEESRTLASLRDGLLPKLMRGEVRVMDVENML